MYAICNAGRKLQFIGEIMRTSNVLLLETPAPGQFKLSTTYYTPLDIPQDTDNPLYKHAGSKAKLRRLLPTFAVYVLSLGDIIYFAGDTEPRRVLSVLIRRGNVEIKFKYGMSINDTEILKVPGVFRHNEKQAIFDTLLYDILTCIPGDFSAGQLSFRDFCSDFGYNQYSRAAKKTHKQCVKQYIKLSQVFTAAELECFPS